MQRDDCSAIILAGGESSRMGVPKPWLQFAGRPLLEHLVERMQTAFPEVLVVTAPGTDLPSTSARMLLDDAPGEGPLAGLLVGLREANRPLAFVASCDLPFFNPEVARQLVNYAANSRRIDPASDDDYSWDVAAPEWGGRLQPLHAIYRTGAELLFAEYFLGGGRRMMELLRKVARLSVGEELVCQWDPSGRSFWNVNTPEDYAEALAVWEACDYVVR